MGRKLLHVTTRKQWRNWLAKHHQNEQEVWLVVNRKSSPKKLITLWEAVEEALCFGWIDSQVKSVDKIRYASRFTPRRKKSHWSESNLAKALRLASDGKVTPAGLAMIPPEMRLKIWRRENKRLKLKRRGRT
jgi:uncharacterized protein YdeI (YjbR/CyaY-like superfamily)